VCRPRIARLLVPDALPGLLQPARQPGAEGRSLSMGTGREAPLPALPLAAGTAQPAALRVPRRRLSRPPLRAQRQGPGRAACLPETLRSGARPLALLNPTLCAWRQGAGGAACLLEATRNGAAPLALGRGLRRAFLEDGDTVRLSAHCQGDGFRVGFGECAGTVLPTHA
jgi:hypothetical protein